MTIYEGVAATSSEYELAEGILWDDREHLVRWVDIWNGRILHGTLDGDQITQVAELKIGQTTGALAMAEDGGMLIAGARGLVTVSPSGRLSYGPDILANLHNVRLNDGSADIFGAFIVGTLSLGEDTGEQVLLRVWPNGRVETLREGIGLSNGVAFSPDGSTIYHVDTLAGTVSSHSYWSSPFARSEPWVTVLAGLPALPDGLTVDSTGALWVAQWGGSSVRRYSPRGELLDVVTVDAVQVSCPGFVGTALDRLAITTAREGLNTITDKAGTIFVADVKTTGVPAHRWAGSTAQPYWLTHQRKENTA